MKTIVWDVDDVLNDLMRGWFEQIWRAPHPSCTLNYGDIVKNPPCELLGIRQSDYLCSLDSFRQTDLARLQPVAETLNWFENHGHKCRHIALTSVPLNAAHLSGGWVMQHFGRWIRSFNIVPSPRDGDKAVDYDHTKKEFLNWWGKADFIVDDSEFNIDTARELGVTGILMPRPWNRNRQGCIKETLANLAKLIEA